MTASSFKKNWKRPFFTIWTGQALSLFGSSLAGFALVWWLTSTTGSATILTGSTLMMILPQVILGPLAGTLVDRWNRRMVMIVADSLIALFSLGMVGLFALGAAKFWQVYLILMIRAIGGAFHTPAMQASTPLMVPEKQLNRVAGMNNTLEGVRSIAAPPLAALLLGFLPVQAVLMVDVITALLAVVPLLFIAIPNPHPAAVDARILDAGPLEAAPLEAGPVETKSSVGQEMKAGLCFMLGWPGLLILVVAASSLNILMVPAMSLMPLLVTRHFGLGALELGWLETVIGIGMLGGGLLLSLWGGFRSRIATILAATVLMGAGYLLCGLAPVGIFPLAMAGVLVAGIASPIVNGLVFAMIQAVVPPVMQGRVFSLLLSAAAAAAPLGLLIAGPVSDRVGVQFWFILTGSVTALVGLVGPLVPALMRIEGKKTTASSEAAV